MAEISDALIEKAAKAMWAERSDEPWGNLAPSFRANFLNAEVKPLLLAVADDLRADVWDEGYAEGREVGFDEGWSRGYRNIEPTPNPYRRSD